MAVYEPFIIAPDWVKDRIYSMGLTGAASSFRALATSASGAGDSTNAAFFSALNNTIQHSPRYPGGCSARNTIMTIRKA